MMENTTFVNPLPVPISDDYKRHEYSYIVHGATVKCTCGGDSTTTLVIPDRGEHTGYGPKAMHVDGESANFAGPFAECMSDPNKICTLSPLNGTWDINGEYISFSEVPYTQDTQPVTSSPAFLYPLMWRSTLICWKGGIIWIEDNGQKEAYIYDPENWQDELYDNIKKYIDIQVPAGLSEEEREEYVDAIIIREAYKLQKKYETVYISSDHILGKIGSPGLHKTLESLYNDYPSYKGEPNRYAQAFADGLSVGLNYGLYSEAMKGLPSQRTRYGMPTSRTDLHQELLDKGYQCKGTSEGGYVTYTHPNGTRVDIRPNGEVISTQKEWLPDHSRKITERYFYDGNKVPDGGHNTGEFVEPIGPNTFLPPKPGQ